MKWTVRAIGWRLLRKFGYAEQYFYCSHCDGDFYRPDCKHLSKPAPKITRKEVVDLQNGRVSGGVELPCITNSLRWRWVR